MSKKCKKCLLLEAGEKITYNEIQAYIQTLDKNLFVSEDEYYLRIEQCKNCNELISGMCLKCGCYVEIRARLKKSYCPNDIERKW